jgi:diamine N-acetyltransferase
MSGINPSMVGKKIYLRPETLEDITVIHEWRLASDPQALSCRPIPIISIEEITTRIKRQKTGIDRQKLVIVRKKDNTLIGEVSFFDYNSLNRSMELGILVNPEERQSGYGKEALRILCRYLFRYRGLNKVYAQTAGYNKGAIKLLEGCGFKQDGLLRDHYFYNGQFFAGLIYSLLLFEFE